MGMPGPPGQNASKGTSAHSKEWLALGKTKDAYDAVLAGAKTLAAMSCDLICQPEKIEQARREFEEELALLNQQPVFS